MQIRFLGLFLIALCSLFTLISSPIGITAKALDVIAVYDCEGTACSQVTLTWDNDNKQFRVQNDSDRRVRIDVTTFAGDSTIHVEPQKSQYLLVKTFNGPYRANYE